MKDKTILQSGAYKNWEVGVFMIIFLVIGILFGLNRTPNTKIISQTIYRELNKVIKVELAEGWECEKPEMDTDLLQPSGYWIGATIDCWKLETPIEEYRIEQCVETKDNYWCDKI